MLLLLLWEPLQLLHKWIKTMACHSPVHKFESFANRLGIRDGTGLGRDGTGLGGVGWGR